MRQKKFALLPDMAGVLCLAVFLALLFISGERMLIDGDTLWHIRAGTEMMESGSILTTDIFSHTRQGQPWTAHEWGAEILMAAAHWIAGIPGVVVMYCLVAALTFLVLFRAAERFASPWATMAATSLAFVFAQSHLLARPHLFSWLLAALTLFLLTRGGKGLYLLPPLTLLWANIHGGFILGLALQGIFLAGPVLDEWPGLRKDEWRNLLRERRTPITVLLLSVLASGANPFGYRLLVFLLSVTSPVYSTGISEWLSPDLQANWQYRAFLLLLILLATLRHARITWTDRLLILFVVNASLVHRRHISIAAMLLLPLLARMVEETLAPLLRRPRRTEGKAELPLSAVAGPAGATVAALLLLAAGSANVPSWSRLSERIFPLPKVYSWQAVRYLEASPPEGNMFNEYSLGDFLIYATDLKVFIDGRADMYGEELFSDYRQIAKVSTEAEELLEKYKVAWIIFPTDHLLLRYLLLTGSWEEAYRDDEVSIVVRSPSPAG